ncbi:low molecular weight protein-tyrosine-phosphatase [Comamonadaceae bacterium PP-2]
MNKALIVCIGNICRSPMAQAILQSNLPNIQVHSAGIGALVGHKADPQALNLMAERGLDIQAHRAKQIDEEDCRSVDIILVMEQFHRKLIEHKFPFTLGKVYCLGHFDKIDIPDPYQQDRAAFEFSLKLIDQGIAAWMQRIKQF